MRSCNERRELACMRSDPFPDRHCETALGREWLRCGKRLLEPAPKEIFAQTFRDLQGIGKPESEFGDHRVEKWRASLQTMGHQAAVDFQEQIIGQPIGAIERL